MSDLRRRVGGRTGKTDMLHGPKVRDIIPHIEHVLFVEIMLLRVLPEHFNLIVYVEIDILNTQVLQPLAHAFRITSGDHHYPISFFDRMLQGITIPGTHATHLLPRLVYQHTAIRHYTVHVENKSPDRFEFFKYAHVDNYSLTRSWCNRYSPSPACREGDLVPGA